MTLRFGTGLLLATFLCSCGGGSGGEGDARGSAGPGQFTFAPLDLAYLNHIVPLGNLNPDPHTLPTDHMYFNFQPPAGGPPLAAELQVVAPAGGVVVRVSVGNGDNGVRVRVTDDFSYQLDHIIAGVTEGSIVAAGQPIGTTASNAPSGPRGVDFGVEYKGVTQSFVNPKRYASSSLHADSPLKYFAEPLKSQLYAKVWKSAGMAVAYDGALCFDQAGKLAGNWFEASLPDSPESVLFSNTGRHLSFARDNTDPGKIRISIGSYLTNTVAGLSPHSFGIQAGDPDPATIGTNSPAVFTLTGSPIPAPKLRAEIRSNGDLWVEMYPAGSGAGAFTSNRKTYRR